MNKHLTQLIIRLTIFITISILVALMIWRTYQVYTMLDISYASIEKCSEATNSIDCFTHSLSINMIENTPGISSLLVFIAMMLIFDAIIIYIYIFLLDKIKYLWVKKRALWRR